MKIDHRLTVLFALVFAALATPTEAADRMRAGQWSGTTIVGGRTYATSNCISPGDAAAMNGDAKAVQAYLESIIPPAICKITDLKAAGSQVVYTVTCGNAASKVVTTNYHGGGSEGTDSTGAKTDAKWVGPCN